MEQPGTPFAKCLLSVLLNGRPETLFVCPCKEKVDALVDSFIHTNTHTRTLPLGAARNIREKFPKHRVEHMNQNGWNDRATPVDGRRDE